MPEMPALAKNVCTHPIYRVIARRVLLPWALQGVRPAGEALEIGSGSGAMAAQLLSRSPDLRLVVTDYDPEMVEVARQILASFGGRATVQRADAADLPFEDDRFDYVFSFAMLHHVMGWEQAITEAVRVLRPRGRLVGYDLVHGGGHHSHARGTVRIMRPAELLAHLARLGMTDVSLRPSMAGRANRFQATKPN
jgi:SAM-dependent methyltransferase